MKRIRRTRITVMTCQITLHQGTTTGDRQTCPHCGGQLPARDIGSLSEATVHEGDATGPQSSTEEVEPNSADRL